VKNVWTIINSARAKLTELLIVHKIWKINKILSFSYSLLGSSSFALASIPFGIGTAKAQEAQTTQGTAADLGVMSISLKDAIQPNFGFQGALQGAGTPNQAGIGGFLPLAIGDNSVFFLDAQANANFVDYDNYSSIINTKVAGTTISTSSRLGYRWLNGDRSWMFGVNAGYDSRPMATGGTDNGVYVTNSSTVFYQQVAAGLEAISNTWNFNAYALIPVGTSEYILNSNYFWGYFGGALDTYGLDVGYSITPDFKASVGYYYQDGDLNTADGSGVLGRLAYNISNGLTAGVNLSYDQAYETRFSADLKYRFGGNGNKTASEKKAWQTPVIQSLTENVKHRDVRIHDGFFEDLGLVALEIANPLLALAFPPGSDVPMLDLFPPRGLFEMQEIVNGVFLPLTAQNPVVCLAAPALCLLNNVMFGNPGARRP